MINFFSSCISRLNDESYDLLLTGDYNLPGIDLETISLSPGAPLEVQQSAQSLLSFMSKYLLSQYVMCPTRGNNILDLVITNNDRLVTNVNAKSTAMSDHQLLDVMLAWDPLTEEESKVPTFDENSFRSLDFYKADFDSLRSKLDDVDWLFMRSSCSFEEFPAVFTDTLFKVCSSTVPQKTAPSGRPKHIDALRRKRNRQQALLQALIDKGVPEDQIRNVKNSVALLQYDIMCAHNKEIDEREVRALEKIRLIQSFSTATQNLSQRYDQVSTCCLTVIRRLPLTHRRWQTCYRPNLLLSSVTLMLLMLQILLSRHLQCSTLRNYHILTSVTRILSLLLAVYLLAQPADLTECQLFS